MSPDGWAGYLAVAAAASFVLLLLFARTLNRRVRSRTAALADALEELRTSEALYRTLFEGAPVGVGLAAADGSMMAANDAMCRLFGVTQEEMAHMNVRDVYRVPEQRAELVQRVQTMGGVKGFDVELKRQGGEIFFAKASVAPVDVRGQKALLTILEDVTESRRAEARRLEAEAHLAQVQRLESIGTLAGGIAHDFNNILGTIMGYAEMSLARLPEDQELLRTELSRILQAARRAAALVKQILSFSRQERQVRQPLQMRPLIKEALKLLRATLPSTIEIREQMFSPGPVLGDPTEIQQVVVNLCTNAGLAMRSSGGVLEVGLEEVELDDELAAQQPGLAPGRFVKLTVKDSGCGIAPEVLGRIFEPFFTTRPLGEGTGLGLSVVHGIVGSCGGTVTVESESGKGTVFCVFLPLLEEPPFAPAFHSRKVASPGTERVLLVDDEEPLVKAIGGGLRRLGYRVSDFTDSVEALEAFRASPGEFDLVITDMTMPGLPGDALTAALRQIQPGIPIILATGFSENMSVERAEELGIDRLVMKPLLLSELTLVIRQLLDGSDCS